jgi:hypothetical protein
MSFDGTSLSGYTAVLDGIVRGTKHNGGKLAFGPDGYLYVATGDGHRDPQGLAWDRNGRPVSYVSSLLGRRLWRIPIDGDTECADTKKRQVQPMNETVEQTKSAVQSSSQQVADTTAWQTPGCEVVECALEVTAYSLNSR